MAAIGLLLPTKLGVEFARERKKVDNPEDIKTISVFWRCPLMKHTVSGQAPPTSELGQQLTLALGPELSQEVEGPRRPRGRPRLLSESQGTGEKASPGRRLHQHHLLAFQIAGKMR